MPNPDRTPLDHGESSRENNPVPTLFCRASGNSWGNSGRRRTNPAKSHGNPGGANRGRLPGPQMVVIKYPIYIMDLLAYFQSNRLDRDLPEIENREVNKLYYRALLRRRADLTFMTFTEGNNDYSMTMERAARIIGEIPDGDFRLEVTFIKYTNEQWKIEKSRNPIRDSSKKHLFTLNKQTKPGALVGIDAMFYDVAYPVTVVIYSGYKIKKPNPKKLKPMRHPGNCVAKLVKEFYSDSTRGGKLTGERRKAINTWQMNVKRTGGTIENMKLETMLKRRISVQDIMNQYIYPGADKYQKAGPPIKIYQHNGHAWREIRFPRCTSVVPYDDNPLHSMLHEKSIWLLDDDGDQFITQDGTLYWPKEEHRHIQEACDLIGEDFSEEVFSSNSLNFLCAKKRNGWRPTAAAFKEEIANACVEHGHGGLWNIAYDYAKYVFLDMKHCYPASFRGLGECSTYYQAFGHPDAQFFKVALDGEFPFNEKFTGFVKISKWKLSPRAPKTASSISSGA